MADGEFEFELEQEIELAVSAAGPQGPSADQTPLQEQDSDYAMHDARHEEEAGPEGQYHEEEGDQVYLDGQRTFKEEQDQDQHGQGQGQEHAGNGDHIKGEGQGNFADAFTSQQSGAGMTPSVPGPAPPSVSPEAEAALKEAAESGCKIYLANMTWWTTDVEVETLCSEFGKVLSLEFLADRTNGKSKGCVAVEFATPEAAVVARNSLQGYVLQGRPLTTTYYRVGPGVKAGPPFSVPTLEGQRQGMFQGGRGFSQGRGMGNMGMAWGGRGMGGFQGRVFGQQGMIGGGMMPELLAQGMMAQGMMVPGMLQHMQGMMGQGMMGQGMMGMPGMMRPGM